MDMPDNLPPELTRQDFDTDEEYQEYLDIEAHLEHAELTISPEVKAELTEAARAHLDNERTRISLSVPARNLSRLKARALELGMPYQTLINSVLHQWLSRDSSAKH